MRASAPRIAVYTRMTSMRRIIRRSSALKRYSLVAQFAVRYGWIPAAFLVAVALSYSFVFGPANEKDAVPREVIVEPGDTLADVVVTLEHDGLVKHAFSVPLAAFVVGMARELRPGGYRIAPSMDAWSVLHTLTESPYLAWIEVPQGLRREEIASAFAETFAWDEPDIAEFLEERSVLPEFEEGAYYAGVYLLPSDVAPQDAARLLRSKFKDAFAPYELEAREEGKTWKEVVTLASLIERESSRTDKELVAGILENRLKKGMKLQVDASLQYITGNAEEGWWHAPSSEDKFVESPYNTYENEGLPPAPIASPARSSIEAALNPQPTSCLYYLHEHGRIHCSPTYAQHLKNIDYYLR